MLALAKEISGTSFACSHFLWDWGTFSDSRCYHSGSMYKSRNRSTSMASGNHTWRANCADLATAPANNKEAPLFSWFLWKRRKEKNPSCLVIPGSPGHCPYGSAHIQPTMEFSKSRKSWRWDGGWHRSYKRPYDDSVAKKAFPGITLISSLIEFNLLKCERLLPDFHCAGTAFSFSFACLPSSLSFFLSEPLISIFRGKERTKRIQSNYTVFFLSTRKGRVSLILSNVQGKLRLEMRLIRWTLLFDSGKQARMIWTEEVLTKFFVHPRRKKISYCIALALAFFPLISWLNFMSKAYAEYISLTEKQA